MRVRIEGKGEWDSVAEAARELGVTKKWIYNALSQGTEDRIGTRPRRLWTAEDDRLIQRAIRKRWSYTRIAAQLGTTKNAIAGRVYRLRQQRRYKP